MSPLLTQPSQDRADHDSCPVDDGGFVIARRQSSPMLPTGERMFDDAAPSKRSSVECRRPPTYLLPYFLRVAFGPFLRDHCSYAAGTQVVAVTSGSVSTVSQGITVSLA